MRYSFCFLPFDVKYIRLAARHRQKCDEKTEIVTKSQKKGRMGFFLAKKTKEKPTC